MNPAAPSAPRSASAWSLQALWTVLAAFATYFCMYGFRKPYAAAEYGGAEYFDLTLKSLLVTAQTLGYALSKFIGIRVISEMPPARRAGALLGLIAVAELTLILFGILPRPWNIACMFLNGLPLGMVFGLVMSFLEGRQISEALLAGLCASFIVADGAAKAAGAQLLKLGIAEDWMPAAAGLLFAAPLIAAVAVLARTPAPSPADTAARSERVPMTRSDRWAMLHSGSVGLAAIVCMYLLTTILRSVRADFAAEIWRGLGVPAAPDTFVTSEMLVAAGVVLCNGCLVFISGNLIAFRLSLSTCLAGFALILAAIALRSSVLSPFLFMTLTGLGLYLPYVAVHASIFERLLAITRGRGNAAFLMYLADSTGYLGYVGIMFFKNWADHRGEFLPFYLRICELASLLSLACVITSLLYFSGSRLQPQDSPKQSAAATPPPESSS
ncbi:MAG: hypothetical protein RLZZ436_3859 [Planctomycetota bacterium]